MTRVVTEELTRRLEAVGVAFQRDTLEGVAALPGNPRGIHLKEFGAAVAVAATAAPDLDFMNTVMGLFPDDSGRLDEILDHYRDLGLRPWFELAPAAEFGRLSEPLAAAGFVPSRFHTFLAAEAAPAPIDRPAAVDVREVSEREHPAFAQTLTAGWDLTEDERVVALEDVSAWPGLDGHHRYVATVDGELAGAALLTVGDGIGYLATASTAPAFRRRGVQAALIARRMRDAREAGCELIASQAALDSTSQHNLERAGLRIAFTKSIWRTSEARNP